MPPARVRHMSYFAPQARASLQVFEFWKGIRLFPCRILIVWVAAHEFPRQFGVIERENVVVGARRRRPRRADFVRWVIHDTRPVRLAQPAFWSASFGVNGMAVELRRTHPVATQRKPTASNCAPILPAQVE